MIQKMIKVTMIKNNFASLIGSFYFFYFAIVAVHIIFIPKVLSDVGYSASEIGIIFASAPLVRFILPFLFIRGLELSVKIFNSALFLMITSSLVIYFGLYNFWILLFANITLGIGLGLILPYVEVIALESIGKERYGKIRLFGSIGFVLVALVLVKFLSTPETALLYLMAMIIMTTIFAYTIAHQEHHNNKNKEDSDVINEPVPILKDYLLWLGLILMQVSFGAFYNFFTIYETGHGISLDFTIYLWSFGVLAEIVMLYFQAPLLRKNLLVILQIATGFTALRWFILFLFPENLTLLFASQAIHALSFALFHSAAISYLFFRYQNKKLAQQFFAGICYGMGGFLGAIGAGYIYEYMPDILFLVASGVALSATIFLYMFYKNIAIKK